MNLDEARNTYWLGNYPRPMGELFDEGYLDRWRLEWAVRRAYDPRRREAAKLLLKELERRAAQTKASQQAPEPGATQQAVAMSIRLEQARSTLWPFPPYKGQPMGGLVDARTLTLKDLGYAVENARDPRVSQAAQALSLVRLKQTVEEPAPPAGPVHLFTGGRSYAERKQLFLMLFEGMVMGFVLGAMLVLLVAQVVVAQRPHLGGRPLAEYLSTPTGIVAIVIAFVIVILLGWLVGSIPELITKRLDKLVEEYRRGQEGEDRAVELILQALDGNWSVFRNVSLPTRNRGDLDIVLLGPPGIWVLEVKNYHGQYRNVGDQWEYCQHGSWKRAASNPSRQARTNALRLKDFLAADKMKVYVNAAVVWASVECPLPIENPTVAVWQYERLADELGNLWQGEKLSQAELEKITRKLSRLYETKK